MLHSFTRNHNDLSTDAGFQFEFFCDCCGNGFKSSFRESSTYGQRQKSERFGRMASTLGGLLGGKANDLGWALERGSSFLSDRFNDQSPEWRREYERAFDEAQDEVRPKFVKCPACSKWVCSDCWNDEEGLCIECAPREAGYVETTASLADNGLIRLAGATRTTAMSTGGIVCTSGTGGIFPKDLLIGEVTEITDATENISSYAIVQPYVDFDNLIDVFIITEFTR